jgi:hypothetical protein
VEAPSISRWVRSKHGKTALLAILPIGAGLWFGTLCRHMGRAYQLFLFPPRGLLRLLLWLILSQLALAVTAGLIAVLFRPRQLAFATFGLSGAALLLGWGWTAPNVLFSFFYVVAALAFTAVTQRELWLRIHFSVRPVAENWRYVAIVLLLLVTVSFYNGFSEHVRDKGLAVPERQADDWTGDIATDVVDGIPLSSLQMLRQEAVGRVQRVLKDQLQALVRRIERYIPPVATVMLFLTLLAVTWLLWWVPILILYVLFAVLLSLDVAQMVTETIEVQRLVLR